MAVEGTPFIVENDTDDDKKKVRSKGVFEQWEASRSKIKKPEALGILAVEPKPEKILAKKSILAESHRPVSEVEAPDERIGKEESRVIVREMVMARQQAGAEKPTAETADPQAAAEDAAVEHFRNLVVEDGEELEAAYTETLAEMGAEPDEEDTAQVSEAEPAETPEDVSDAEDESSPVQSFAAETPDEIQVEHEPQEGVNENENVEATKPADAGAGEGNGGHRRETEQGGDEIPDSNAPANDVIPPGRPPAGMTENGFDGLPTGQEVPGEPVPKTTEKEPVLYEKRQNAAAAALLGGIIGYLIGRRRGRIKTEKRLLPIQKKLEKEVNDLEWEVRRKETKIRAAAARRYQSEPHGFGTRAREEAVEQIQPVPEQSQETRIAPETNKISDGPRAPEHIGHMLLASEAEPEQRRQEAVSEIPAQPKAEIKTSGKELKNEISHPAPSGKRIDTLNRVELMDLGEKIVVDGSNLRQMYETHLIGERGLRRLVAEHLDGGDLRKVLRNEVLEREMDFERDPVMRDLPSSASAPVGGGTATLNKLLEKAAVSVADSGEEAAFFKARARYEAVHQQQQHHQQRRIIDITLSIVIAGLVVLVVIMYLTWG